MRRFAIVIVMFAGMLVFAGSQQRSSAQEAIPEAMLPVFNGDMGFLTYANFGTVDVATLLGAPLGLSIFQLELAPGAGVTYPHGVPAIGAHLVESGTLTLRDFSMDIMVTRAPKQGSPDISPGEMLPAGSEARLGPGDGFLFPQLAAGEILNDGTEPVVLAVSVLYPVSDTTTADVAAQSSEPACKPEVWPVLAW